MVPVFRLLSRIDNSKDRYIIFSQSEIDLYAEHLGIDRSKMHYLPCGDWGHDPEPSDIHIPANTKPGDYYFSGGYSNRDYLSLIEAFRKIPARLMIICSSLNKELDCVPVPPNVEVLRDVPSSAFEAYLRNSKAGTHFPEARHRGLRTERHAKAHVQRESYHCQRRRSGSRIDHGVSGYLTSNLEAELPGLIARIESDPHAATTAGEAARAKYLTCFCRKALSEGFEKILFQTADSALLPAILSAEPSRAQVA